MVNVFSKLLRLRPLGGYGIGNAPDNEPGRIVEGLMPKVEKFIGLCERNVETM